jgi:hypothetical protein
MKSPLPFVLLLAFLFPSCHFFLGPEEESGSVSGIVLDKTGVTLDIGQIDFIALSFDPPDLQRTTAVSWDYDASYISVDSNSYGAVITGLQPGSGIVTARAAGFAVSCAVSVTTRQLSHYVANPYVYSDTEFLSLAVNETARVSSSLFGGTSADVAGFSFSIDNPLTASLVPEGNYVWITGKSPGMAKVTVRHNKSAYGYSFLVSCAGDGQAVPYLTTSSNIVSINKNENPEYSLSVDLVNAASPSWESQISYTVTDAEGNEMPFPPVSLLANGRSLTLTGIAEGTCQISVGHPEALYPLTILVRVSALLDNIYIEPSASVLYVSDDSSATLTASLLNVPAKVTADTRDFAWSFSQGYEQFIDAAAYGSGSQGSGDTLWITGKKSGTVKLTVSHPLAVAPTDAYVIVRNIRDEAADVRTFISTSQNYVATAVGEESTRISVYINNASPGDENGLHWTIVNSAADGSGDPVISWDAGTGTHSSSSSARSAIPVPGQIVFGNALISPLKPGTAAVTISHPKAAYDTKISVTVRAAGLNPSAPSFVITSETPSLSLQNGTGLTASVSLSGSAYLPGDENDLIWFASNPAISLTANGASALVESFAETASAEYLVVNHPKAATPLHIPLVLYNDAGDLAALRYITPDNPYRTMFPGETLDIAVTGHNIEDSDPILWNVIGQSPVSLAQVSRTRVTVTALNPGVATVTATLTAAAQTVSFYITVKSPFSDSQTPPSYFTTSQNVVLLDPGEEKLVFITPVNIPEAFYDSVSWSNSDPSVLEVIPNGANALFRSTGQAGKAVVTVSSPRSENSLEIYAHVGDRYEYKNPDYPYISTPHDTLILTMGAEDAMLQAVLAHTSSAELETSGFAFSIADASVASVFSSGNTAFITPVSPGNTRLTVTNPRALYSKEVLIIVEKEGGNAAPSPYITTAANVVTVLSGETVPATVSLENYSGYDSYWIWQSENPQTAGIVTDNGTTAVIRGYMPGTTYVTVTNTKAAYPLRLIVICVDAAAAREDPWIKTTANILTVRVNSSSPVSAEMIGGDAGDNNRFTWSLADAATALVSGNGQSVIVRGLKAGVTTLSVRNTAYPASYVKTVLLIVEKESTSGCYITVSNSIIRLRPDSLNGAAIRAGLSGGTVTDPQDFIWWADDYKLIALTSITDTAQVQPLGASGVTYVHVKHPKAAETADILVTVGTFDEFSFSLPSKNVSSGQICFVPLQTPPVSGKPSVAYRSLNETVCTVTGSASVAMIAGAAPGQTTLVAELSNASGLIATAELAVIVSGRDAAAPRLTTLSSIVTLNDGQSKTLQAALQGAGIQPEDKYNISWESSDPSLVSLFSSGAEVVKGENAYITAHNAAKSAREAVLTVSHPKCETALSIWVVIPGAADISMTLDQTYIEMYKDDGTVTVTATLANAAANDYNNISWTAPKSGGATIISITKAKGKTCNLVPRTAGQTTLRAQLPNGVYADCIVVVKTSAQLRLSANAVHVNPGFSETLSYTVVPENAFVNWLSQFNSQTAAFDFSVDEYNKTLTVTGKEIGTGAVTGYFADSSGGATTTLQVYVEYTYELFLDGPAAVNAEPRGQVIKVPFEVYPRSVTVEAFSANTDKLEIRSVSHNKTTGKGEIEVVPLGEGYNVMLTVKASNPDDLPRGVVTRTKYFNLYYEEVTFSLDMNYQAGAFTRFNPGEGEHGRLYLGDGETRTFSVRLLEENAEIDNLAVSWIPSGGSRHVTALTSLTRDPVGSPDIWRISHGEDAVQKFYTVAWHLFMTTYGNLVTYNSAGETSYNPLPSSDPILLNSSEPIMNYDVLAIFNSSLISIPFSQQDRYQIEFVPFPSKTFNTYTFIGHTGLPFNTWLDFYLDAYVDAYYEAVTPYVIKAQDFDATPNLWYQGTFLYDKSLVEEFYYTDVKEAHEGVIRVSFKRFDGQTYIYDIPVTVQVRECPAYYRE